MDLQKFNRRDRDQDWSMMDQIKDAIILSDFNLRVIYANSAYCDLARRLGYQGEIVGKTLYDHFPDFPASMKAEYAQVFESGQMLETEERAVNNRQLLYAKTQKIPLIENGKVTCVLTVIHDVTRWNIAYQTTKIQKELALKTSTTSDLDDLITLCLDAAIKVGEMDAGSFYLVDSQGNFSNIHHKGLSEEFSRQVSFYTVNSSEAQLARKGQTIFTSVTPENFPNDEAARKENIHALAIVPISYEGNVIGGFVLGSRSLDSVPSLCQESIILIANQIGTAIARARMEIAQKESDEKFRNIVAHSRDGIILINEEGKIVAWNAGLESITGLKFEDVVDKISWDIQFKLLPKEEKTPENLAQLRESINHWLKYGEESAIRDYSNYTIQCPDGPRKVVSQKASAIKTRKGYMISSIVRDITEEKRAEETLQRLYKEAVEIAEMRRNLVTFASHELRTPLVPIMGWIDFIKSQLEQGKSLEPLIKLEEITSLANATHRLDQIIEDFLDVHRIETGRLEMHPDVSRITPLIQHAIQLMSTLAAEKSITVQSTVSDTLVFVDTSRMEQVFVNLLSNAIKYSPEGSRVEISSVIEGGSISIIFRDQGRGFTTEELQQLWEPFSSSYLRRKEQSFHKGSGVGLFICKGIIDLHGGKIKIQSDGRNKGSKVTVQLPRKVNIDNKQVSGKVEK